MHPALTPFVSFAFWVLALGSTLAEAEPIAKTFAAAGVVKVRVEQASGLVTITATDSDTLTVKARKIAFESGCALDVGVTAGELRAVVKESGRSRCEVAFDLTVPRAASVTVDVGTGDVQLTGLAGDLDYRVGRGNVTATEAAFGNLKGRSGAGNVSLSGTADECELKIGAGNADLAFSEMPEHGKLDLKLGTGNAVVRLPRDARVKSSFKAGMGSMTNEIGDSAEAKYTISGTAGTGDLTIRKL